MKYEEVEFTFQKTKKPNRKFTEDEYPDVKRKKTKKKNFKEQREAKRAENSHDW